MRDVTMHNQFMHRAYLQACLGRGLCAPNPSVGAVLVYQDKIISEAWHQGVGQAHAEQRVLDKAKDLPASATLYVTLEPCNHWGRTPPCVKAIIEAGIKRVFYGYADPNPLVAANDTPAQLRAHGIEVIHYPLALIEDFYQSYRYWTRTRKPVVTVKMALSLDGKIAGKEGKPVHLSNEICHQFTHEKRRITDRILTTAQTVIQDNPAFTARLGGMEQKKAVAIIDSSLKMPATASILKKASHCYIYHNKQIPVTTPYAGCHYHAVSATDEGLDLKAIIEDLGAQGAHDIWVEAGGRLFTALHQAGLVQRTWLYLVPQILGRHATEAFHDTQLFSKPYQLDWQACGDNMIACFDWNNW